jgi:transcriptional regulator with XRE-family HTH domain
MVLIATAMFPHRAKLLAVTGISRNSAMPPERSAENFCAYPVRVEWTRAEIKRRLGAAGMSQQELAEALGVSRKAVSNWVNGHAEPSGRYLQALDKVLGGRHATNDVSLASATNMDLLAELARRFAAYESTRTPDQPIGNWRWSKEDAPSARRRRESGERDTPEVDHGTT